MAYSYQELQSKLKKINENQLSIINDNIQKVLDSAEKGYGDIKDHAKKLKDLDNERRRIEEELWDLT